MGGGGGSSITSASREEPPLVSYAEVSLSLLALNTQMGFRRAGLEAAERGDRRESQKGCPALTPTPRPLPHPKQSPGLSPGYVTCPRSRPLGLRIPRRPCLVCVLLPWTHQVVPLQAKPPPPRLSHQIGARRGKRGKWKRKPGPRELTDLKKNKNKKRYSWRGPVRATGRKGRPPFGGPRAGGRGSGSGHQSPSPGPQRRRQLHTQKPIVTGSRRAAPRTRPRGQARQRPRQPGRAP